LELTRYIHLNPVRARIVERPEAYDWSSYRDYLASGNAPAWLDRETVIGGLAKDASLTRLAYRRFVEAGLSESVRSPLTDAVGGVFLGASDWVDRWRRRLSEEPARGAVPAVRQLAWRPTLEDVVAEVSKDFDVKPAELLVRLRHGNEARSAAIYLARLVTDEAAGAIGRYFGGVSTAAISKAVARAEERRQKDRAWDRRLKTLSEHLTANADAEQELKVKT
jgi:chromosomal replication initiation ATPase DnaA